jgi:hypothetical protein
LIWAVEAQKHFVIHYEHGGRGVSYQFLIISSADQDGKRKLEGAAVSFQKCDNLERFLVMAKYQRAYTNQYP